MIRSDVPLKRLASIKARVGWKGLTSDEFEVTSFAYLVTGRDFRGKYIDWSTCYQVSRERYEDDPFIQLRDRDLLVTKDGTIGKVALVDQLDKPACLNSGVFVVRPHGELETSYLYWILQSEVFSGFIAEVSRGSTIQHLYQEEFRELRVPLRRAAEQRAIADDLDRETAQIDALIAKNEELIALLSERRAAVIREGTSLGTDATAEFVDSRLDDVGVIPAGWRVMRLSWLFRTTGSGTTPPSELMLDGEDADVWWVTTGELRERTIESTSRGVSLDTLAATSALKIHPAGSLLIAMYGATIGRMGVLGVPAASNQAVCALSGPVDCVVEFVEYAMLAARERLLLEAVGGGQPNINQETVRAFRIPVPPLVEQQRIVAHLRERVGEVDRAIGIAERGIELARERRSALISAVVTGKIEVGPA